MTTPTEPAAPTPTATLKGPVVVHVFGKTDVGRTREHNEDAFIVCDLTTGNATLQPEVRTHTTGPRGSLFMVADGMGGAAAGEIASAMAVETMLSELRTQWVESTRKDPEAFAGALKSATDAANRRIHAYATEHPENRGMGTTATVAGLLGDTLYITQVGDSRAYLVRGGAAKQITKDQSLMQRLIEANELTEEEAEQSERRNIILQALGPEPRIKIDLTAQQVRRGDVLILCSDGLSGQVKRDEIAKIATEESDLVTVCKRLIDAANEAGGPDNITVIAARFEGDGLAPAGETDLVGHAIYALTDDRTPTTPVPVYVKRHSGTPPGGIEKYEPSRPTRELVPDPVPATTRAAVPPSKSRLGLVLLAAVFVVAALVFAYSMFRGMTGSQGSADSVRSASPAADSASAVIPATDTATTPNVTPDTAQPPAL